jgi:hypothetical protein
MKRTLGIAFAVLLGLGLTVRSASAGGDYDYYHGAELFVARANTPVYDRPSPGGYTNIRLRAGSYLYASCWDGWEGWCRIRTRYFKNMYIPRYALDSGYGGYRHKSYYYKKSSYDDCSYKESYNGYRSSCYDEGYYPKKGYGYKKAYHKDYGYKDYGHKGAYSYGKDYGDKSYGKDDDYDNGSYGKEYGYKKSYSYEKDYSYKDTHSYGKDYGYKAYSYEKDYGYKDGYKGKKDYDSDDYEGGHDQDD